MKPKLSYHRHTGRGYVTFQGKRFYLKTKWDGSIPVPPQVQDSYDSLCAELIALGKPKEIPPQDITIIELGHKYQLWVDATLSPGSSLNTFLMLKYFCAKHGMLSVNEFGPLKLKEYIKYLIKEKDNSRKTANGILGRIKVLFKWGVSMELVKNEVYQAIATVQPVRHNEHGARGLKQIQKLELKKVAKDIEKIKEPYKTAVTLIALTGCRSSEILGMSWGQIDTSGEIWIYRPREHKNAWRGSERVVALGKSAQQVLGKFVGHKGRFFRQNAQSLIRGMKRCGVDWGPKQLRKMVAQLASDMLSLDAAAAVIGDTKTVTQHHYAKSQLSKAISAVESLESTLGSIIKPEDRT